MSTLVNVKDLSVSYFTYAGEVQSVRGVSFEIEKGKTTAIVGESRLRKIGHLQIADGPDRKARRYQGGQPDSVRGQKHPRFFRKGMVRLPRQGMFDDFPGRAGLLKPHHDGRQTDHGKPAKPQRRKSLPGADSKTGPGDAGAGRHPGRAGLYEQIPA